ncbi:type VI secretion system baseplate subunit TssE [Rhodovulum sp. DZ06]|uniref:type VI secretion system baseplate subunit TssE n=1 Tax=Rhodovulum sp. DZ06 TaxID=3425126 RepID=UPI003D342636
MPADSERFWPSLRDRLKDRRAGGLPIDDHFLTAEQLRAHVKRDLENLFNATSLDTTEPLDGWPRMRRSVLNFGAPDLTGRIAAGIDATGLERRLRDVILAFEPRLRPDTVRVRVTTVTDKGQVDPEKPLKFEIMGEIYATPVPEQIYLSSTWDVELNKAVVEVETS